MRGGPMGGRGGGRALTGFVRPPPDPSSASRPSSPAPYERTVAIYSSHRPAAFRADAARRRQGAYQHGLPFGASAPTPLPSPYITKPTSAPSRTSAPCQPARVSARTAAPPRRAPSPASAEQKIFITEAALAPPTAAAAVSQLGLPDAGTAAEVDHARVFKKGLVHPARPGAGTIGNTSAKNFLVADNIKVPNNHGLGCWRDYYESLRSTQMGLSLQIDISAKLFFKHVTVVQLLRDASHPVTDRDVKIQKALCVVRVKTKQEQIRRCKITGITPIPMSQLTAESKYKITIAIPGSTELYHNQQFLSGIKRDMPQETNKVFEAVRRQSPSSNYVSVSRSFFSTIFGHRRDNCEGLQCWRGYYQRSCPNQMGFSLNIDTSVKSFRQPVIESLQKTPNLLGATQPLINSVKTTQSSKKLKTHAGSKWLVLIFLLFMLINPVVAGGSSPHRWCNSYKMANRVVSSCQTETRKRTVSESCCAAVYLMLGPKDCFCQVRNRSFFLISPLSNKGNMVRLLHKCSAGDAMHSVIHSCDSSHDTHATTAPLAPPLATANVSTPVASLVPSPQAPNAPSCGQTESRSSCKSMFIWGLLGWIIAGILCCSLVAVSLYLMRSRARRGLERRSLLQAHLEDAYEDRAQILQQVQLIGLEQSEQEEVLHRPNRQVLYIESAGTSHARGDAAGAELRSMPVDAEEQQADAETDEIQPVDVPVQEPGTSRRRFRAALQSDAETDEIQPGRVPVQEQGTSRRRFGAAAGAGLRNAQPNVKTSGNEWSRPKPKKRKQSM